MTIAEIVIEIRAEAAIVMASGLSIPALRLLAFAKELEAIGGITDAIVAFDPHVRTRTLTTAELVEREQIHERHAVAQERKRIREQINQRLVQLAMDDTTHGAGQRSALKKVLPLLDIPETELTHNEQVHTCHAVEEERKRIKAALIPFRTVNGPDGQYVRVIDLLAAINIPQTIVTPLPDHDKL